MKKRIYIFLLVILMSLFLTISICACKNNEDEETITTYTYSFNVKSNDYTYELELGSTGSWNLNLKEGSNDIYNFNMLAFSKESDTLCKFTDSENTATLKVKLNSDNTFEIDSVSGEIFNLILGYEVYAGDYTISIGDDTDTVTLNTDGTIQKDNDELTFLPWNGGKIFITDSQNGVICTVDLQNNHLDLEGAASNNLDYIFDANLYEISTPFSFENIHTKLYLSQTGEKALFKKSIQDNDSLSYFLYYGEYENNNDTVSFTAGEYNINLILEGVLFDYYYEKTTVGEKSITLYPQINKTVYVSENERLMGDTVNSNEDYYIFTDFTQDEVPVKVTHVIDKENLNRLALYFGNFQGVEGDTYIANDNSEIIIVNSNTLYQCSGNYTQTKQYTVETYTSADYDQNVIIMETGGITHYYLDGETYHYYSPPFNEQKQQIITNPTEIIYGKDIAFEDSTTHIIALLVNGDNATVLTYNLSIGTIATIQHDLIVTGSLSIDGDIYEITTDNGIYQISITNNTITAITIIL